MSRKVSQTCDKRENARTLLNEKLVEPGGMAWTVW